MKAIIFFILLIMLTIPTVFGQIKIGDNPQNIDPASVLELESSSKVLVITRVSTLEMEAITPQRGGIVYNTDTECIHYYDGTQWINLCDAVNFTITNDPIINNRATIEITQTADGYNLEIAKNGILGDNIVDGGIGPDDIQDNSITQEKLAAESVGSSEIRQNAVGSDEIRDGSIAPNDMANFIPGQVLVTDENGIVQWGDAGDLMGAVGDEITITGSGTPANPLQITEGIQLNISNNTALIADHIIDDQDTDDTNELIDLDFDKTTNTLSISQSANPIGASVNLEALVGSDDQQLTLEDNILSLEEGGDDIDLTTYLDNTDEQNLGAATLTNEQLTITIDNGNPTTANLSAFATDAVVTTGLALKENIANKNPDINLGNSNVDYPTQNAVKVYVDNVVGGSAQTIVSTAANNSITPNAIDGGAFYNDLDGNATNEIQNIEQVLVQGNNAGLNPILGLDVSADPTSAATRGYVDANLGGTQDLTDVLGNGSSAGNSQINDLLDPALPQDAATKAYVDTNAGISTLSNGFILVGNGGNAPAEVAVGGDATMNNLGEVTIIPEAITPAKIEPGTNGQFLSTAAGAVAWADLPPTAVGSTEEADGITITGTGTNADPFKIEPGANGQFLSTTTGAVTWENLPAGTGGTVIGDNTTIEGNGSAATPLQIVDGGVTSTQIANGSIAAIDLALGAVETDNIADNNVTVDKIAEGTDGQVLLTNGTDVVWGTSPAGASVTGTTIDGDGTTGNALELADNAVTSLKIAADVILAEDINTGAVTSDEILDLTIGTVDVANNAITVAKIAGGTDGQILTTTITGVQWQDAAGSVIVSADTDNSITESATDGGAYYDDKVLTTVTAANTAAIVLKEDAANKSTDGTLADNSDDDFPTEQAVKTYVDGQISGLTIGDNLANANLEQTEAIRTYEVGTGESLVFTGLGNVGFGNGANPPLSKFHFAGEIRVEGVNSADGTVDNPAYTFSGDTNNDTGIYRPAADEIGFSVGGYEALRIDEPTTGNTNVIINQSLQINNLLLDKDGQSGTAGQILSSTGGQTDWINAPTVTYTAGAGLALSAANEFSLNAGTIVADWNNLTGKPAGFNDNVDNDTQYTAGAGLTLSAANEFALNAGTIIADWNNLTGKPAGFNDNVDNDTQYTAGAGLALSAANEFSLNAGTIVADWGNLTGIPADIADGDADTQYTAGAGIAISAANAISLNTGSIPGSAIENNPTFAGNVTATSFTTGANFYPDYVFQKYFTGKSTLNTSYEFSTLETIEAFLKKHHHLPGVASVDEIKTNEGKWNLTEGALINLEKIEELFLHTIEQEKKIKQLESTNKNMASEVETLKAQMEEIKTMLLEKTKE
ncbi:hypothetical protein SAMN04488008_10923 [Maribacter orientalis]|uniref:Head domain of trimeric autotransporter adhesin n=1 Tax=Maribacter orientalis TaxID=228957 RepID=A0A1H7VHH7_9FLAO|nr:hypothetical protein [Maribacter orientalis]SEM08237.1 hypothetical protein SAMN04488008_10923 [Maribacter orientalis]